jgi:hypothetical protein
MRNIPDVSLFGDYDTGGYAIYYSDPKNGPNWYGYNGTSASSPLWSSFSALVNQQRANKGMPALGLANPLIYQIAEDPTKYAADFHDINDGSTNGYYKAVKGYDDSTGWGSFKGSALLSDMSAMEYPIVPVSVSVTPNPIEVNTWGTYRATISAPAPAGGTLVTVTLGSSSIGAVTIPAGATSGTTGIEFFGTGTYTVGATVTGEEVTTSVSVVSGLKVGSVSVNPNPAVVGRVWTVTVTLDGTAPLGGTVVSLTWNGGKWTTLTVPAGETSTSWNYTDNSVGTDTIGASYGGNTVKTTLQLVPFEVSSVSVNPDPVVVGKVWTVTVKLDASAPTGGTKVPLTWNGGSWTSLTVPAGSTSTSWNYTDNSVGTDTIGASYGGNTVKTTLQIQPLEVTSVSVNPAPAVAGSVWTITVGLNGAAPSGGAKVTLTWNGGAWTSLTVAAGATKASWNYTESSTGSFTIGASYGGNTVDTVLKIAD